MSHIDYAIIILFVIVIIIKYYEHSHNNQENYTTLWTPFSQADPNLFNSQGTAANISLGNSKPMRDFNNFGIIGKFPAIPICNSCKLDFDCVNYDYTDIDDKNANVCRRCGKNVLSKNYGELDKPLFVYARSAGRPRQTRQINL